MSNWKVSSVLNHSTAAETALEALSTPSILLPSQYIGQRSNSTLSPERFLFYRIIEDAIECWLQGRVPRLGSKKYQRAKEAARWIWHGGGTVTFEQCCEVLRYDPDWVRERLLTVERSAKLVSTVHGCATTRADAVMPLPRA